MAKDNYVADMLINLKLNFKKNGLNDWKYDHLQVRVRI